MLVSWESLSPDARCSVAACGYGGGMSESEEQPRTVTISQGSAPLPSDGDVDVEVDPAGLDPEELPATSDPDAMNDDPALGGTAGQGGAG